MSRRIPTNLSNLSVCYQSRLSPGSFTKLTINSHRKQPP
ncbi:unnamed protein product [Arabidopsis halleri]